MEKKEAIPGKMLTIESSLETSFFKDFLECLKPVHGLTPSEMDVLARFLYYRYQFSKDITNPELLDQITMSSDTRRKIREDMDNMSVTHFQVIMSKLKKSGVISEGRILPKFIPAVDESTQTFKVTFMFKLHD